MASACCLRSRSFSVWSSRPYDGIVTVTAHTIRIGEVSDLPSCRAGIANALERAVQLEASRRT